MKIIVVSGAWCTGKTHMANKLSEMLGWPVFSYDYYKEKRYDQGEEGELVDKGYEDLFQALLEALGENQSCIIESDFTEKDKVQSLIEMAQKANAELIQVYLYADDKVLIQRFIDRVESGERHQGHGDQQFLDKAKRELETGSEELENFVHLDLPGSMIKVDTTNFDKIDYQLICEQVKLYE